MADVAKPQRSQHYVDRDLMLIAMRMGIPAVKAANDIVGKVTYERGDRGVTLVRYGDLSSPPGEAFLSNFIAEILGTYPSAFEAELYEMAKRGELTRDERRQSAAPQPTEEQLARMRDTVSRAF